MIRPSLFTEFPIPTTKTAQSPKSSAQQVTPKRVLEVTWGFAAPLMVEAAIRTGVFDCLDKGAQTLEQIADETGASERGLKALLNGLVGIEFLHRQGAKYALAADVKMYLVTASPQFMGGLLIHGSRQLITHWMRLPEIVRSGKPAITVNRQGVGGKFFSQFVEGLFNISYSAAQAAANELLAAVTKPTRVLDLAAGSGVWGIAMAEKSPHVTVTAVDWPAVIPVTRKIATKHNLATRFTYVAGDLLDADFGAEHQVAILGHILHSEGEWRSRKLLEKVFAALAKKGTLVISDFIPEDDRTSPAIPLIFAVNMLVNTDHGDTFTFKELKAWLTEFGFTKIRRLETAGSSPLILAEKP